MSQQTIRACSWLLQSIDFFGTPVPIDVPETIGLEELEAWKPFVNWKKILHQNLASQASTTHAFHEHPYSLRKIEIQSVDRFGPTKIGFVKLNATIERDELAGDKKGS
jgi:ADP-sugar diphosphatase